MFIKRLLLASALLLSAGYAAAQSSPPLFFADDRAHGASFDLAVTEIARKPAKSYLAVPGFHARTGPQAAWLLILDHEPVAIENLTNMCGAHLLS
jgi:hypothetical protein